MYSQLHVDLGSEGKPLESELVAGASRKVPGITVYRSVEFSYEELAQATNGFSGANVIGIGGFGSVYYAELRGEVRSSLPNHSHKLSSREKADPKCEKRSEKHKIRIQQQ